MDRNTTLAPIPEPQFQARYWRACGSTPFPPLPMTLGEASTLTEQKLINNVIALGNGQKRQNMELRALQARIGVAEQSLHKRLHRYEWLLILLLGMLCLTMLAVGMLWRALT